MCMYKAIPQSSYYMGIDKVVGGGGCLITVKKIYAFHEVDENKNQQFSNEIFVHFGCTSRFWVATRISLISKFFAILT